MCKIKVFLLCFLIYIIKFSELKTISNDVEFEYFREFIDDIKSQMDNNAKPCNDFRQFACGNSKEQQDKKSQLPDYASKNLTHLTEREETITIYHELKYYPLKFNTVNIHTLFSEVDFLKKFEKWPVGDTTISDEDIMRLLVEYNYLDAHSPYKQMFFSLEISEDRSFYFGYQTHFRKSAFLEGISEAMESFGATKDSAASAISDIEMFLNEAELILNTKEQNFVNSTDFETLKNTIKSFDWNLFFKIYAENLYLDQNTFTNFRIYNIKKIEKLMDLMKKTNQKTFANYLIWCYIKMVKRSRLYKIPDIAEKVILFQDLLQNYLNQNDKDNAIEIIDRFEKSVIASEAIIKSNLRRDYTKSCLINRREVFNDRTILSSVANDLKKFNLKPHALYYNTLKLKHFQLRSTIIYDRNQMNSIGNLVDSSFIEIDAHNKPMLYYFVHDYFLFSWKLCGTLESFEQINSTNKCFPENKDEAILNGNYRAFTIMNTHEGFKLWLKENEGELVTRMNKYLEEIGLTQNQAFWLAMQQNFCNEGKYISKGQELVLKKIQSFSKDFNCENLCQEQNCKYHVES